MTGEPETDRRPRWRKKRWWAAGLLWLAIAYPATAGPAAYATVRGWLPAAAYDRAYVGPVTAAVGTRGPARAAYDRYVRWWLRPALRSKYGLSFDLTPP